MREAIQRVLKMLQEGRLTEEEAELLISAMREREARPRARVEPGWTSARVGGEISLSIAGSRITLSPGPELRWRVLGHVSPKEGGLSIMGGDGELQVPKLPLDLSLTASKVWGDLGGAPLSGRVSASKVELDNPGPVDLRVVGSKLTLRLSRDTERLVLRAQGSKVDVLVPDDMRVSVSAEGEKVRVEDEIQSQDGIPLEIEAHGSLVSVRRG